jgi:hypothetical protein
MATDPADAAYTGYMLAVLFVLPCGWTRAALVQQCQTPPW